MALAGTLVGLSILIIGDSHLSSPNSLIASLQDNLLRQGAQVHSIGVCGVEPADWTTTVAGKCGGAERIGAKPPVLSSAAQAHTTPIAQLIQAEHPNLVLIVMGDTMAAYQQLDFPMNWEWQQVSALTGAIGASSTRCAWVGPAWGQPGGEFGKNYARAEVMSQFLAANVAPCAFIDSQKMSGKGQWPTIDGQHFTPAGYRAWGDGIAGAVVRLVHPPAAGHAAK